MMAAVVAFGVLAAAQPADAGDGLAIGASPRAPVAPANVTLTASVSSTEAILAYEWEGLSSSPRCRIASCEAPIPIASCRRVAVEATNDLGETLTATRALCAAGAGGGEPPQAELTIVQRAAAFEVTPSWRRGSNEVVVTRLWIDAGTAIEPAMPATIEGDGGCHVIDLLVADSGGLIGIDHRTVCFGRDAPRIELGAMGGQFPALGGSLVLCTEADHPLGRTLELVSGDAPLEGCGGGVPAPSEVQRYVVQARDSEGIISTASVLAAGAPASGAPVLMFAQLPFSLTGREGQAFRVELRTYGAEPPLSIDAVLALPSGGEGVPLNVEMGSAPGSRALVLNRLPAQGMRVLGVSVRDARGLTARATAMVTIEAPMIGPGPGPDPGPDSGKAACNVVGASPETAGRSPFSDYSWIAIAAMALLMSARVRGRRR